MFCIEYIVSANKPRTNSLIQEKQMDTVDIVVTLAVAYVICTTFALLQKG
jgi:hypothetical protein